MDATTSNDEDQGKDTDCMGNYSAHLMLRHIPPFTVGVFIFIFQKHFDVEKSIMNNDACMRHIMYDYKQDISNRRRKPVIFYFLVLSNIS